MKHIICDEDHVDKTMTNLKVIGKIGPGFKVNTKGKYLQLDDTTYWQGVMRWYRGDSRTTMYEKIHSTVHSSLLIVNMAITDLEDSPDKVFMIYHNCTPSEFLKIMLDILKSSRVGMDNLKDTYDPDPTLSSRLEMDILSVKNQINIISSKVEI